ncbi:unnamed protein product [Oppiella nova]|uniref:Large ribosomal subunit protein uL29m n=1 Tax=Oppiella nova TaxID=334625 RepID=A0A7R9QYU1_9ACAR|nr:unnamed protein product [Oppiella nova]CAG2179446.1 unnamed protein product [Oppiella nova]
MEFFDDPKNWTETEIKTGREWRKDELRIKSNSDLHKLWYVLYKERNMLMTMAEAAKEANEVLASPERIDKVEISMKNLEDVVRERNKAYWELEVGEGTTGERPKAFRRDIFGRWRWIGCSEHMMPYRMNTKWRAMNAPGFGKDVIEFNLKLKEKKLKEKKSAIFRQSFYCRQLMRRFPDLDLEYLQEKFPDVDVKKQKDSLDELCKNERFRPFHRTLYHTKKRTDY